MYVDRTKFRVVNFRSDIQAVDPGNSQNELLRFPILNLDETGVHKGQSIQVGVF